MKDRQSNIECLRLVAMLFVLVLHTNYLSIGSPKFGEVSTIEFLGRNFMEAFTFIAVNVFILISGYFSIQPKAKSIYSFLFMCFFYSVGIRIFYSLGYAYIGKTPQLDFWSSFLFLSNSVWFVVDYLMLMLFAPILNKYVEHSSKKELVTIILLMILFSSYFGLIRKSLVEYVSGFSFVTFILIYLIGRYVRLYVTIQQSAKNYYWGYVIGLLLAVGGSCVTSYLNKGATTFYSYTNPIFIFTATCAFLLCARIQFTSKKVNYISKSTFALLLIHSNPAVIYFYMRFFSYLHTHLSFSLYVISMLVTCAIVFCASILIDQIRILIYDNVALPLFNKVAVKTVKTHEVS